ncbi:hypothetical protein E4G67_03630 [Candidatus Bathyarchaeota archaeon]|nr:MAG: hypothetical protein E4G67_03630 [Candidatus Bathyarchaeota archaeon]
MNKNKNLVVALFLICALTLTLVPFSPASAADPRQMTSYCYLNVEPNPVGVGQQTYISLWVDTPFADANYDNPVRRHDYKLTITDPDGNVALTQSWPVVEDTTGVTFTSFVPIKVGIYTAVFEYAGQTYVWNATTTQRQWTGTIILPASRTMNFTVQQDPLPFPLYSYPLPTEYWTRPIEGQNLAWYTIHHIGYVKHTSAPLQHLATDLTSGSNLAQDQTLVT